MGKPLFEQGGCRLHFLGNVDMRNVAGTNQHRPERRRSTCSLILSLSICLSPRRGTPLPKRDKGAARCLHPAKLSASTCWRHAKMRAGIASTAFFNLPKRIRADFMLIKATRNRILARAIGAGYTTPYAVRGRHTRASPSGKASASQADTRGFESRCPLHE